jgi:hypothetical protein
MKIDKVKESDEKVNKMIKSVYEAFDWGQRALDDLRCNYPTIYTKILTLKQSLEMTVEQESYTLVIHPGSFLVKKRADYTESMEKEFGIKLEHQLIECLANEAVSDWIVRCPIDF